MTKLTTNFKIWFVNWSCDGLWQSAGYCVLFCLQTSQLTGLARFYSLSYVWYTLIAVIVTVIIGLITSFITREPIISSVSPNASIQATAESYTSSRHSSLLALTINTSSSFQQTEIRQGGGVAGGRLSPLKSLSHLISAPSPDTAPVGL